MWTTRLDADETTQVLALAARAETADGTAPLNEEAHFALGNDSAQHFLLSGSDLSPHGGSAGAERPEVVGYLQWQPQYATAQLVVDPQRRRSGVGRQLVAELTEYLGRAGKIEPPWGIWAFGDLPPAKGFAAALGLAPQRGLLIMERHLDGIEPPVVPEGLKLRGFEPSDAADLLAVNAAAFAHHPEQGALDEKALATRIAEPWFAADGLILAFDESGLAGFHWTKRHDQETGEVYVIGVAPRAQGRGYGKVLLQAGLSHLLLKGAARVILYVDMAERVAVRMYESAGFRVAHRDVRYAPEHARVQKQELK